MISANIFYKDYSSYERYFKRDMKKLLDISLKQARE